MQSVSKFALAAALALGGASVVFTSAVDARPAPRGKAQPEQQVRGQDGRQFQLSAEERTAIVALQTAIQANDFAAAQAALPAAQATAQSADARYMVGALTLRLGLGTQNLQQQRQGIDLMIASGAAPAEDLPQLYSNQGALATSAGDLQTAERAFSRLVELTPNDPQAIAKLAEVKHDLKKPAEAVTLITQAIGVMQAAGQTVPENWYKRGLAIAYDGRMAQQSIELSRKLVTAYPTSENWRDALLIFREMSRPDAGTNLDLMRLMRVNQSLSGERDYFELAETLHTAGLPGEAKAVLDDGIARRMIDPNKQTFRELIAQVNRNLAEDRASLPGLERQAVAGATGRITLNTADAVMGYGNHARAAELYRLALQRGGVDNDVANTRLGIALALAGQRAEAEAAFRAVGGQRRELANFWLLWLSQRA